MTTPQNRSDEQEKVAADSNLYSSRADSSQYGQPLGAVDKRGSGQLFRARIVDSTDWIKGLAPNPGQHEATQDDVGNRHIARALPCTGFIRQTRKRAPSLPQLTIFDYGLDPSIWVY